MLEYPEPLARLISELQRLPTIGPKTAQRCAFFMLKMADVDLAKLGQAIVELKVRLHYCGICGNITDQDVCVICKDPRRDHQTLCVVEEPDDLLAIEKTQTYKGLYHALMGVLSPLEGITPKDLRIDALFDRVSKGSIKEVILATNYTMEGQATALYLTKELGAYNVVVSRIAYGIPVGGDLEYIDSMTLAKALEGRRKM